MWESAETISDLFKKNVACFPNREAMLSVSYNTGKYIRNTWNELDETSDRLALGMSRIGVKKGNIVALMLSNSAECYYTYLAIHKIGAVFIPINIRLVTREIEYIIEHAEVDYIISGVEYLPILEQIRNRLNVKIFIGIEKENHVLPEWVVPYSSLQETKGELIPVLVKPNDIADILYTSGTTGLPKGVVLTQSNKVACGRMFGNSIGLSRQYYGAPTIQTAFSFFTSTGCSMIMMSWLYYGFKNILEPAFNVEKTLELIEKERSSIYGGAPSMFVFILNDPKLKEFDTSSIRSFFYGSAPMPMEVLRQLLDTWNNVKVYHIYGLTEAGPGGTVLDAADAISKFGSIGLAWAPDQEVRIVDHDGNDLPTGNVGEIILRGPNIMKEYYKNTKATLESLRNGWLYTGDMGYADNEGYIFYTDRLKDMIVRGGFNVYPVEVENAFFEHNAVKQCAVVGKPHDKLGEDIVAFVVLKEGEEVTTQELEIFVKDKLADFKRPRDIRFVDELPLNPSGKVDKKTIRSRYIQSKK